MFTSEFGWKAVLLGYGCGLVFGSAMGYLVFKIGKPQCLLRLIEEKRHRKGRILTIKDLDEEEITAFKECF